METKKKSTMSRFLCLYIPQFPAWVWEQSSPPVRGQAFVVVERDHVVAVSNPAQDAGLLPGMTTGRAESRWRSGGTRTAPLLLIERDRRREELAWSEMQRAVYGFTPKVEPLEEGLLFAEVESSKVLPLVRGLEVRAGCAKDRATAWLAALTAPPQTTRTIPAGKERSFADHIPLQTLSAAGVGPATIERLRWFGWTRLGHLRALSRRQLEEQFGREGELLFRLAQGASSPLNLRPVATWKPPAEVVARLEFEIAVREPAEWEGALDELLACVCGGLETRQAQTLEIEADTPVRATLGRRVLKEPVSSPQVLRRPAQAALKQALDALSPLPPIVRSLTVRLGGLTTAPVQESLFVDDVPSREGRLERTVAHLESRFAGCTGRFAVLDPNAPFPEDVYGWQGALEQRGKASPLARAKTRFLGKGGR